MYYSLNTYYHPFNPHSYILIFPGRFDEDGSFIGQYVTVTKNKQRISNELTAAVANGATYVWSVNSVQTDWRNLIFKWRTIVIQWRDLLIKWRNVLKKTSVSIFTIVAIIILYEKFKLSNCLHKAAERLICISNC